MLLADCIMQCHFADVCIDSSRANNGFVFLINIFCWWQVVVSTNKKRADLA